MSSGITPEWLGDLVSQQAGPLELYAAQWTRSPGDVVQEAFMKLVEQSPLPTNPEAWLYRTVKHRVMNAGRGERRRARHEREAGEQRPRFAVSDEESVLAGWGPTAADLGPELESALRSLPDDQREVIVARLWGQLTLEETAELSGTSIATAHRRYYAGLENLRQRISTWTSTPNQNRSMLDD